MYFSIHIQLSLPTFLSIFPYNALQVFRCFNQYYSITRIQHPLTSIFFLSLTPQTIAATITFLKNPSIRISNSHDDRTQPSRTPVSSPCNSLTPIFVLTRALLSAYKIFITSDASSHLSLKHRISTHTAIHLSLIQYTLFKVQKVCIFTMLLFLHFVNNHLIGKYMIHHYQKATFLTSYYSI